jgi:hypothetical protein
MEDHWCQHAQWNEDTHRDFYDHYHRKSRREQERGLLKQAHLWSQLEGQEALKAAESLMILWFMHHGDSKDAQEAQRLIEYINKRLRVLEGEGLMGQSLEPPPAPK